ncbi:hypothetical protein [Mycobacteroides abscessus]|uniref:hypothetical protein n=1 Tax=Mycobacteroides abscessus TaxID=36809 RepID=UPI0019CF9CD4|nr:hypothetical protein [Mycobacteroides abscessus]MBN7483880.1 hypothetical protein [Mycobacteroides abscessus subsp. massiliense]
MSDEWTVVPAPQGITVIDAEGKTFPIIALRIKGSDVIPLYLDSESRRGVPIWGQAVLGMSKAWIPDSVVPYELPDSS